ncbi:MAG TPA: hypothetical protein VJN18_28760 [Polyangiaceae bacterium]|nr:hypothetical protein [Polyangiaceae bacterium]
MDVTHRLRSWFLRGVLEALERHYGAASLALLTEKVPRRLLPHASLDRLKASATLDAILLDDGEELLLFMDSLLGEGNGKVLEAVGYELASRALHQGGVAKFGDLHGTVARLQAFLDHPFVDTPTLFELKRTDLGFTLTVGVIGRPRATRVLRHLAVGAVTAAERSARGNTSNLRLSSELLADRATLSAKYEKTIPSQRGESEPPPTSLRRPTTSLRPPSLSEEVERILSSHKGQVSVSPRTTPTPSSYRSSQPAIERASQPSLESVSPSSERTSDVQRVARRSSQPNIADERISSPPPELKRSKG